jgi:hypothetical protein
MQVTKSFNGFMFIIRTYFDLDSAAGGPARTLRPVHAARGP